MIGSYLLKILEAQSYIALAKGALFPLLAHADDSSLLSFLYRCPWYLANTIDSACGLAYLPALAGAPERVQILSFDRYLGLLQMGFNFILLPG